MTKCPECNGWNQKKGLQSFQDCNPYFGDCDWIADPFFEKD